MANKTSYELHHNFPKLADESGFAFNLHRPRMHVDWNKIKLIDLDSLVRERKFGLIEQHVNDILNCVLESEFDVRILNEGVLKIFRLAQLAVEYQQFCRHYLDRSVYVLKEEISALIQELDIAKKDLRDKEEETRKLKRKTKHRTALPYGNDNIATMILKTLTNKGDLFPSTSNGDIHQYNKCGYCDKVFLNQLYLKSHISRRHPNILEIPQRDVIESTNINTENKLSEEIKELKEKLKEMEALINENKQLSQNTQNLAAKTMIDTGKCNADDNNSPKKMKDAEVSTNSEDYLLDKIEEWKKEEHEKYNKEIMLLRTQIMETINSFKEKEKDTSTPPNTQLNIIDELHKTIREQGAEILILKQELNYSKVKAEKENAQKQKESEEQMAMWTKRMETQSNQYDLLLQKLNNVAKEAQESRNQAEKEKERVEQLQVLLQESMTKKHSEDENDSSEHITESVNRKYKNIRQSIGNPINRKSLPKSPVTTEPVSNHKILSDHQTLERLHQKAQELLKIGSMSSSSSDVSSIEKLPVTKQSLDKVIKDTTKKQKLYKKNGTIPSNKSIIKTSEKKSTNLHSSNKNDFNRLSTHKEQKLKKEKSKTPKIDIEKNGPILIPRSPIKVVRAKITEEVNNRLVSAGMDPLKSRLPKNVFQKQRLLLQQQNELKSKKNPDQEKIRHSILAYLDSTISKKDISLPDEYVSPDKVTKTFSLTSVLSNVKSKALSLVKSNDITLKNKRRNLSSEVTKRALSLLKTPSGSSHSSPATQKHSPINVNSSNTVDANNTKYDEKNKSESAVLDKSKKTISSNAVVEHNTSDSESIESDHKYYKTSAQQSSSKSIENLIKSPARRPASANADYKNSIKKYALNNGDLGLTRTQSAINVSSAAADLITHKENKTKQDTNVENLSSDGESFKESPLKKTSSEDNVQDNTKQTKSVLKNASSTSSLNKKKVLFDMDAIQMKSVSASPSQSITEKSDGNDKYELGLINLDGEEWDISSIENEPLKNDTKIQINTRTSPKIAELKQTIESQLARRNDSPSTVRVGGVDVLGGQMRASSIGGSNTSLGSSILDDFDGVPVPNHRAFVKSKSIAQKDDSELDLSEFSIDGLGNKNESF